MPLSTDTAAHKSVTLPPALERNRLLDVFQLAELTGYSVAHLRRLYRANKIPAPIRIGGRKCGWPAHVAAAMTGSTINEAA